jgi:hypothetical protein
VMPTFHEMLRASEGIGIPLAIGAIIGWYYKSPCRKCGHERAHHAGDTHCLRCHDDHQGVVGPCWGESEG